MESVTSHAQLHIKVGKIALDQFCYVPWYRND